MRKRISKYKHLHSNRFRYWCSSIPLVCASGLLFVAGMMICVAGSTDSRVYANSSDLSDDTTDDSIALALGHTLLKEDSTTTSINYISTPVNVTAQDIESYRIVVQAAYGNGSLVGLSNGEEIKGVGSNVAPTAFTNNTWGYKLAEGSISEANLANLTYSSLPANGAGANAPAYTQKTANEAANGKNFTLAFAAKFGDDTMPDHYQTDILVSLTATPKQVVEYNITYNANSGTGTPNPASQSISSKDDTYTFTVASQGTLARSGHTFLGWSENPNATTAQYTAGSSTITLSRSVPTKVLHAVWEVAVFNGITYMNQMTSAICKSAKENDTAQLIDNRDDKTYWVTKLKDGNCWMTQNLDYDDPNSNKRTGDYAPSSWTSSDGSQTVREYWDPGEKVAFNTALGDVPDGTDDHLLVGNYYSWASATNGTGNSIVSGNASGSICPTNWKLPTSNNTNNGSFGRLVNGLTATTIKAFPYYYVAGGYVGSAGPQSVSGYGYYWSSTAQSDSDAYYLRFITNTDSVEPSKTTGRYRGASIRCLILGS